MVIEKKMRRAVLPRILGIACLLAAGSAGAAYAETEVLTGVHRVVYDIVNPVGVERIVNYKNNGYEIRVLEEPDEYSKRVLVEVKLDPLLSRAPFPLPPGALKAEFKDFLGPEKGIQVGHPDLSSLARRLSSGASTVLEVQEKIANYLRDEITYDASPGVQQDALSVLRTHRGSCVGYTQVSIALLRSLGIPARYAHGYLPPGYEWGITQDYWGVKTSGGGFHAWYEVYYPDAGWTFTDGEYSKNFVDPYHIVRYIDGAIDPPPAGEATLDVDKGATFTLVEEANTTHPIDGYGSPEKTILGRQIGGQQMAAVYGNVKGNDGKPVEKGEMIRWEGRKGTVKTFNRARYAVVGLPGGKQKITIRSPGFAEATFEVDLSARQVAEKDVTLQAGTVIQGKIENEIPAVYLDDARVLLMRQGQNSGVPYPLGEGRSFQMDGLEPGAYRLLFRVRGLESREITVAAEAGKTQEVAVQLGAAGWIEGRVLDASGNPVSGATVWVRQGKLWSGYPADEDGEFTLYGLAPAAYDLKARHKRLGEIKGQAAVTGAAAARVELRYR